MLNSPTFRRRHRRRSLLAAAALCGAAGLMTAVGAQTAHAAVIDGAVRDITVTPTDPGPFDPIRTTIDWCVPNGTMAGDTFTITMPEQLGGFPPSFELLDPSGQLVATAAVGGDPVAAVFTMTDYAETHTGVCGDAWFESRMNANEVADTTQTLVYEVNGDLTFEAVVDVSAIGGPVRTQGVKRGEFADPNDQCRTSTDNCIEWVLTTRIGPYDVVEFEDLAADGLAFECADLSLVYWSVNPDGTREQAFAPEALGASSTIDCTPAGVTVSTGPVPADHLVRLRIPATPDTPAPQGGVVYSNIATITHTVDVEDTVDEVDAESRSAFAGGSGAGVGIDIEKYDTDGNDADTAAESVEVPTGESDLVFTITNTGDELVNIEVTDVVIAGDATVTGLTCDFSMAATGAPTSGTTWAGPFPPGAAFDCTALLSGVEPGVPHANTATVTGEGAASGEPVTDSDDYHANRTPPPTTTAPPTTAPPTTAPPTTVPPTTTPEVEQQTPTTPAPTTTLQSPLSQPLPATGSSTNMVGIALALLAAGAVLAGLAARRPADEA